MNTVAEPIVYTVIPNIHIRLNISTPPSFSIPPNFTGSAFSCTARGLPTPDIEWLGEDGQSLTTSTYKECEPGLVSVVLHFDGNFDQRMVQCVAFNRFGQQSVAMKTYIDTVQKPVTLPTPSSEQTNSTMVQFTLRVLTQDCHNWNVSFLDIEVYLFQLMYISSHSLLMIHWIILFNTLCS